VLEYNFRLRETDGDGETDVMLVSGAITAITAIMTEAFKVSSNVKQISFHDKELMLNFEKSGDSELAFILLTDRVSDYLEKCLLRFSNNFLPIMKGRSINMALSEQDIEKSVDLLLRDFGLTSIYFTNN
jgi:hypothetical protein